MKDPNKKQSAVLVEGATVGCLELLEKLEKGKWRTRCTKCGAESIRPSSTLYWIMENPTQFCKECFFYKEGDTFGCITLLEKIPKEKQTTKTIQWKVRCETCGREWISTETLFSRWKKNSPTGCTECQPENRRKSRKFTVGQIVGNCYELLKYKENGRWDVKCTKCGKIQEQEIHNILKHKKETCYYCEYPEGHINPNAKRRNHYLDFKDKYDNYYRRNILSDNKKGKKFKEWALTKDEFWNLTQGNCYYCGAPPNEFNSWNKKARRTSLDEIILLNGIDRIDSDKGYTLDNCVSCCTTFNFIKGTTPQDVFLDCVEKIYLHQHSETIEKHNCELSRVESSDSKQEDSNMEYDIVRSV